MSKLFYSEVEKAERKRLFYNNDGSPKIQSVSDRDKQRLKGDLKHIAILQAKYQAIIELHSKIQNNFDEHYLPAYHQGGRFGNDSSRQRENQLIINPIAELNFHVKIFKEAIQQRDAFLEKISTISGAKLAKIEALIKADKETRALYQEILKRQAALRRTIDEEYLPEFLNNPLYRKNTPNRQAFAKIISLEQKIDAEIKELNAKIHQLQAKLPNMAIKNTIQTPYKNDIPNQRNIAPTRDNVMSVYRGQVGSIMRLSRASLKFKKEQSIADIHIEIGNQHRKVKDTKRKLEECLNEYRQCLADEEKVLQAQQKAIRKSDNDARGKAQENFECVLERKSQVISSIEEHLKQNKQDIDALNEKIKAMNKRAELVEHAQVAAARTHASTADDSTQKIFSDLFKSPSKKLKKSFKQDKNNRGYVPRK